jgi:FAD-dependent urate hydroxylase
VSIDWHIPADDWGYTLEWRIQLMDCTLLIIGAGPYGLAMAAMARHLKLKVLIAGKPFDLWRRHMPKGMLLRSGANWHIDPSEIDTTERFLLEHDAHAVGVREPLSREAFVRYLEWFTKKKGIEIIPRLVLSLRKEGQDFLATLEGGEKVTSKYVVVAPGLVPFRYCPLDLTSRLPLRRFSHACEDVGFAGLKNRRCLIVGGRQSAFEWAALLAEEGARSVHLVYRHSTPSFRVSDWTWVQACLELTISHSGWFRKLDGIEKERLERRFWSEGRLKLEPWLQSRIRRPEIYLHPESQLESCRLLKDDSMQIEISGETVEVDHVILATGYRMDLSKVKFLSSGGLKLEESEGYPRLDEHFQSSVTGLYFMGFPTVQSFGPFFGFVSGAPITARVIGNCVMG